MLNHCPFKFIESGGVAVERRHPAYVMCSIDLGVLSPSDGQVKKSIIPYFVSCEKVSRFFWRDGWSHNAKTKSIRSKQAAGQQNPNFEIPPQTSIPCINCSTTDHVTEKDHAADARRCPVRLEKYGSARSNERKAGLKTDNPWKVREHGRSRAGMS